MVKSVVVDVVRWFYVEKEREIWGKCMMVWIMFNVGGMFDLIVCCVYSKCLVFVSKKDFILNRGKGFFSVLSNEKWLK